MLIYYNEEDGYNDNDNDNDNNNKKLNIKIRYKDKPIITIMPLRKSSKKRNPNIQMPILIEEDNEDKSSETSSTSSSEGDIVEATFNTSGLFEIKEEQDKELEKNKDISNVIIENSYICFNIALKYIYYTIKFIFKVSGVYFIWIILHYGASHLYVQLCVPKTPWGFLISPFLTATPHCQGLRWIVYNAANVINNMWVILGAWICSTILLINRDNTDQNI